MNTKSTSLLVAPILALILTACVTINVEVNQGALADANIETQAAEHARLATEIAELEATLGITASSTSITVDAVGALPEPIPHSKTNAAYQPIPLANAARSPSGFASLLTGQHTLAGIPFDLSADVFQTQSSSEPDVRTYPAAVSFSLDVPRANKVHLLLNTGNGFAEFDGQAIGQVTAQCGDTATTITELGLGREVREWHLAHNVVYTTERSQQVWTGALAEYPHLTGHIDLLTLDLPESCASEGLTALVIADTSVGSVGSLDPALILFGITVEFQK